MIKKIAIVVTLICFGATHVQAMGTLKKLVQSPMA